MTIHWCMGGSPGHISENPVTQEKRKKGWRKSCDVGEAMESLENELTMNEMKDDTKRMNENMTWHVFVYSANNRGKKY